MLLDFFYPHLQIKLKLPEVEPHLNYDFKIFISLLLGREGRDMGGCSYSSRRISFQLEKYGIT